MKALLLSAYAAVSHRVWAEGLVAAFPEIAWTRLELPPRHFAWSIRANPLIWQVSQEAALAQNYDLVVATSMVDLATLVGLCPALGRAHKVVYFHENQFAFPASAQQTPRPEPMMVNLYAAMAADSVVFNSRYNRDSFCDGVRDFLGRMPGRPRPQVWLERLAERARVLLVPLPESPPRQANGGHRIVWNHRWEYDKNPEAFFAALAQLIEEEVAFEVAVMGQQFRARPAIFDQARAWLGERVVCWGEQPGEVYHQMLDSGAIVVSTTDHEFQGLAIMEAVTRGCVPLVPDRLCFPDYYDDVYRYRGGAEALAARLGQWLRHPEQRPALPDAHAWQWPRWRDAYAAVLGLD
ncbi:DUF3524 domain-containing protein [Salinicola sp. DM10]|uniref:tRNA-queuosine alpha-mannosyltransferase domain-containing protein n=1 Tax=Salinicola sp. DM10 TaxID=2815721 RepID=UPI001A9088B0|nr:DUF3524 domain-containing protein [Salinicola sp. DM10]MCE3028901.1 DUF3524 domain-containing protein [Salinicola sp. DM10]